MKIIVDNNLKVKGRYDKYASKNIKINVSVHKSASELYKTLKHELWHYYCDKNNVNSEEKSAKLFEDFSEKIQTQARLELIKLEGLLNDN